VKVLLVNPPTPDTFSSHGHVDGLAFFAARHIITCWVVEERTQKAPPPEVNVNWSDD
jgi:hypothetical protein